MERKKLAKTGKESYCTCSSGLLVADVVQVDDLVSVVLSVKNSSSFLTDSRNTGSCVQFPGES